MKTGRSQSGLGASERETRRQAEIARQNEQKAVAEAQRATVAEQSAKSSEADALREKEAVRQSLAKSALALAEAARREDNGPEMQAALNDVPEDLRDSTWNYLLEQSDTSIARIRSSGPKVSIESVAAHPRRPGVFAVQESNNHIALVDGNTGARQFEFAASFNPVNSGNRMIAISPDGLRIAAGRGGPATNHIAIHSTLDGKKLLEWDAPASSRLEFNPDGTLLIQEQYGNQHLSVWDASVGKLAWESACAFGAFTPDGTQALTYGSKDNFRVVNAADGKVIRTFKPGGHDVRKPLLVGAGHMMASVSGNGFITVYDVRDGHVLSDFRAYDGSLSFAGFALGGEQIVTAAGLPDGRQAITVWQAATGERVRSLLGGRGGITGIAVHPLTGELLVAGPNARVWSLTGKLAKWQLKVTGHAIRPIFWGSDDVLFASGNGADCGLQKLTSGSPTLLWKPVANFTNEKADVGADGRTAAVTGPDSRTGRRRLGWLRNPGANPEEISTVELARNVDLVRLSASGDRAAIVWYSNSQVDLFDRAASEKPLRLDPGGAVRIRDVGWLAGGKQLLGLVTANAERGNPGSEERVVLWDAATRKIVQSVTNRTAMDVLAISPEGTRFAEAGADKMVRIRDAVTLAVIREFRAHDGPITAIAWHPSKPILATGSADLTVKIWNLETGRRLEELRGPVNTPHGLGFSPSGQRLACSGENEGTRIWEPTSLNDQPAATQPAGDWEDLLASLTTATVEQTGNGWRMNDGVLFSPSKKYASLLLPGNFAGANYQIRVKLRQLAPKDCIHLGLSVADRMVGFELDAFPNYGYYSGLNAVNGKHGTTLPGSAHGKLVKDSEQHDLEVTVRLFGANTIITATVDGQPVYEWSGAIAALGNTGPWRSTLAPGTITLGAVGADWAVYEVKVKRL